jgi:hypothetical protein
VRLADPLSYIGELEGVPDDDVHKMMGGNMMSLLGVTEPVRA